jgi:hypothetical protein
MLNFIFTYFSKIAAMRQLCLKAGLILLSDSSWVHAGGRYKSDKDGLKIESSKKKTSVA